jgi:hypothetical protein
MVLKLAEQSAEEGPNHTPWIGLTGIVSVFLLTLMWKGPRIELGTILQAYEA